MILWNFPIKIDRILEVIHPDIKTQQQSLLIDMIVTDSHNIKFKGTDKLKKYIDFLSVARTLDSQTFIAPVTIALRNAEKNQYLIASKVYIAWK